MNLFRFVKTFIVASAVFAFAPPLSAQSVGQIDQEIEAHCKNLPFTVPKIGVPSFPDRRVSIVEHGAVADGLTMNTKAFADAIQACAKAGGGTVVVPPGTWLTGPIKIEGNINLHLERGALIQFSNRLEDFPLIAGLDGKSKRYAITPPLHAYRAKNIAVTGYGIIDGAGDAWRYVKKTKLTEQQWKNLVASGGVVSSDGKEWWPSKEAMEGESYLKQLEKSGRQPTKEDYASARQFIRPDLAQFVQCEGVLLDGVTFQNSPKFHVRPIQSENVIIRGIKVMCPWYAQNGDGIDPTSCRNVIIYNTTVDVGDDGLCLKPGTIASSQKPGPSCENIVIADCVVYHAHGGFVIGSESYGGVNNISVRNCVFIGTDIGLRFKSYRGNGGLVKNVFIDGIQMHDIANEAILFDMYYGGKAPGEEAEQSAVERKAEPVTDRTPRFQDFTISNIVCSGAKRAMVINALPEMPTRNVTLTNVTVSAQHGITLADAEGIRFTNCRIEQNSGPTFSIASGRDITITSGKFSDREIFMQVDGESSGNINLVGVTLPKMEKAIELGKNVKPNAVIQQ
ncbi:MAG: glycoside hydrolase family 28 protein [Ignavibacteriae bacterium]|nr:glycoside hydrolase family 28 protein [Ignavibacteriota bacterium]